MSVNLKRCLIVNPDAGAIEQTDLIMKQFRDIAGYEIRRTSQVGDAERLARQAIDHGCQRLIIAGGDGTLSGVLNGIVSACNRIEVAIIPFGTGNDLARSLGVPIDDLDEAVEMAISGKTRPIDVVRFDTGDGRYFINVASGGFGGEVAAIVKAQDKKRWGPLAYWMTAVSKLSDLHEHRVHLELDDCVLDVHAYGLMVANGRYVAGGIPVAPEALLDDGLLDLTVITVQPTIQILAAGFEFALGYHRVDDRVMGLRARRIAIRSDPPMAFSIDGESMGQVDVTFEVIPGALRMVTGPEAPAVRSV